MALVETAAARLFYEWKGSDTRPVLVLSHSLGASHEMWAAQVETLGRDFRLLLYDHRGHGKSSLPPGPYTIDDFGSDILAILDELQLERISFCGLSLGGMLGQWLGIHAPDRLDRLILCNTAAKIEDPSLLRTRMSQIEGKGLDSITESVLDRWLTSEFDGNREAIRRMFLATPAEGYIATSAAVCDLDFRDRLSEIHVPTLVIAGRHDLATPVAWNEAIARAIPGAGLVTLDAAHLSNVEAGAGFNNAVLSFLNPA